MQINTPILSVVVPSKNRYETLIVLIQSLLAWDTTDFELIVQDNSYNNDLIKPTLTEFEHDSRLVYSYSNDTLSAVQNCDQAVSKATGEYVCFIGDDDGVIPEIINLCYWLKEKDVDGYYGAVASYTWPDMEHAFALNNKFNATLILPQIDQEAVWISPLEEVKKVISLGAQDMLNMPRLYQGIIRRECLISLYSDCKTFFPGPVPDMSNAIALVPYLRKCCFIKIPYIISGQSKKSMSGKNAVREHQGDIRSEKSIPAEAYDEWTPTVPKYWCGPTIWAEAALKSSIRSGQAELLSAFNYANLYASCLAYSKRDYYPYIFDAIKARSGSIISPLILFKIAFYLFNITAKRVKILISKLYSTAESYTAVSILEAIETTSAKCKHISLG
jgi:glycosyltransferase involved in cell wall biosynthesis